MTRTEIASLIEPVGFRPFVVATGSGARFSVPHPDFVDLPPIPNEDEIPSYVIIYDRAAMPKLIDLANIQEIEFKRSSAKGGKRKGG